MGLLLLAQEAAFHRAAYQALLRGILHQPGSKQHLARQIGVSVQYLSYVLHDERVLAPALAERMAAVLPLTGEERTQFLEHVALGSERRLGMQRAFTEVLAAHPLSDQLATLRELHEAASFARDAVQSHAPFRMVQTIGRQVLQQVRPTHHAPLDVVELCLLLHDTASMLHRQVDALYYARTANYVMTSHNRWEVAPDERPRWDQMDINAIRAVAVTYHNLGLEREAVRWCAAAETTSALREHPADWVPHLYRDIINALAGLPRFAIRQAEAYADTVRRWCDRRSDPSAPLLVLMIERSLTNAYLRVGNLRKAQRLVQTQIEQLAALPVVGPLHQTLVLSTAAQVAWRVGDQVGWAAHLTPALHLATAAGLTHQRAKMQTAYGEHLHTL